MKRKGLIRVDSCKALWAAVLNQAIKDYRGRGGAGAYNRAAVAQEAETWFLSNQNGLNSFLGICEFLKLNPQGIRNEIIHAEP